ncbi:Arc family DNA-binding protein [Kitasatospora aureofaciens]|uniref:Arc family DNA-binding protein n=1 Tax=Kitasatospora aureofaciens TaxID=1894 RepID=UPI003822AC0A
MDDEVRITLRLPSDSHTLLTTNARTARRSLNSEIVHRLEVALSNVSPDTPDRLDGDTAIPAPPPASGRGYPHRGKPDSPPQAGGTPTPA